MRQGRESQQPFRQPAQLVVVQTKGPEGAVGRIFRETENDEKRRVEVAFAMCTGNSQKRDKRTGNRILVK